MKLLNHIERRIIMLYNNYTENLLELKDVILTNVENFTDKRHLHIHKKQTEQTCPCCSSKTSRIHDYRTQKVKDLPIGGKHTYLIIRKRRYFCPACQKKFYEHFDFLPKYQRTTNKLWAQVFIEMEKLKSMKLIGEELNISGTTVARIFDNVSYGMQHLPKVLSIDEFKGNSNGEKFQTILTNPKKKLVLDILPSRKAEDLYAYFSKFKDRKNVELIVMDMSNHFRTVMKNCFPNAKIIADKYHVRRQISWAFDNVRIRVQKNFHPSRRKYFKRSKSLLNKKFENLTDDQKNEVTNMITLSNDLGLAYHLKNEFQKLMDSKNGDEATKNLNDWLYRAENINLPEFKTAINAFRNWHTEIIAAFETGYTNGFTEGCNNKIKVIKRISFGVRNFARFKKRILHSFMKKTVYAT